MTMPPMVDGPDALPPLDSEALLAEQMDAIVREAMGGLNTPLSPNEQMRPNPPQNDDRSETERIAALRRALYGSDFPMADPDTTDDMQAWATWARGLWDSRREATQQHLHLVERNRLFRAGMQ